MPETTSPLSGERRLRPDALPDRRVLPKQEPTINLEETDKGLKISGLASNDEDEDYSDPDPHGQGSGR